MEPLTEDFNASPKIITKKRQKWRAVLIGALALVGIVCLVFMILFVVERIARKDAEEKARRTVEHKICDSEKCLFTAVGESFMYFLSIFSSKNLS
jgi:heme/copper-type cytochrome/quinol oxidase subunit 2